MPDSVVLRDVTTEDLDIFFAQQLDPEANDMAVFTARDPTDRAAFDALWSQFLSDERITMKAIVADGQVAGSILSYPDFGEMEVGYWLGKTYWGQGIATRALAGLLGEITTRPLYARAAKDNIASIRVLQKCGFAIVGEDIAYSNARRSLVGEFVLKLESEAPGLPLGKPGCFRLGGWQ